ncbi:nitroreductase family protein [Agrobacterium salinitolerans]
MEVSTKNQSWPSELSKADMGNRRSVPPALLRAPAPSDEKLNDILMVASRVPDHGNLVPWRFILVRDHQASDLLEEFLRAHDAEEQNEGVKSAMISRLRAWLIGPPATVFLVWRPDKAAPFPELDQLLCAGAVATTFLHAVHAEGFGSIWLTGWPCSSERVRQIMGLDPHERLIGLFPLGTPTRRPAERARPNANNLLSEWRS